MQNEKNIQKQQDNPAVPKELNDMANDVNFRGRIGGLYTKEMVRRGEEIAKELANLEK
ncbi:MAG: hypothetical protein PHX62_02490 [Bacilli bacterium]|nr:hypothetical protein [Bacilli bacterium]